MSEMGDAVTNEWAQLSHTEKVRRATHSVACEGGSEREHALVAEIDRLNERVWMNDPAPNGIRAMEQRIATLEAQCAALREALEGTTRTTLTLEVDQMSESSANARVCAVTRLTNETRTAALEEAAKVAEAHPLDRHLVLMGVRSAALVPGEIAAAIRALATKGGGT